MLPTRIAALAGALLLALVLIGACGGSGGQAGQSCQGSDFYCQCSTRLGPNDAVCNTASFPPKGAKTSCTAPPTGRCCQGTEIGKCACDGNNLPCPANSVKVDSCTLANETCTAGRPVSTNEQHKVDACRGTAKTQGPALCCADGAWPDDGSCGCQPYRCFDQVGGICVCTLGLEEPGAIPPSTGSGSACDSSWCFGSATYCDPVTNYCSVCNYECAGNSCEAFCQ